MADNYLGFWFGDTRVALDNTPTYEGFILNSRDDLMFSSSPEFNDDYANPRLGDYSIYIGTTVSSRTFDFTVILDEITLADYRSFLIDFDKEKQGYLRYDYAPEYGYLVKVSSIGQSTFTVVPGTPDKYIIEVRMSFTTVEDWVAYELDTTQSPAALYSYVYADYPVAKEVNSMFEFTWGSGLMTIKNLSNLELFIIFHSEGDAVTLEYDSSDIAILPTTENTDYFSRYAIAINDEGNFTGSSLVTFSVPAAGSATDERVITVTGASDNATGVTIIARQVI